MSTNVHAVKPVLFMKIGVHAQEALDAIIQRKLNEIDQVGYAFWGYGGATCHPATMVQPFAQQQKELGNEIILCMQKMASNHFADPIPADQFSIDGVEWRDVPRGIEVRGSRYALAIKGLEVVDYPIVLAHSRVALGPSQGRTGSSYIAGRVDKACLEIEESETPPAPEEATPIGLQAVLCEPYAVFLRNV
jgi:hypothetical protein